MEIHILYDSRPQPDKLPPLIEELNAQGLKPTKIWEPIFAKTVVESINLSFKQIIRYAKENKLPEVVICEDDLMFPCKGAWDYFLANKPEGYDVWIGGNYLLHHPETYEPPYVRVREYVGNQLIMVAEKYYDTFLSTPDDQHIDTIQRGLGDFYACWPIVALQRPGFSSNSMQVVNYNSNLKPEWIFNGTVTV